jgi:amidophosphoribosyltransferase
VIDTQFGPLALGHNGNIANAPALRKELLVRGLGLMTAGDSELLAMMLAGMPGKTWTNGSRGPCGLGSAHIRWCAHARGVFAVRDPWGYRPLAWGRIGSGGAPSPRRHRRCA